VGHHVSEEGVLLFVRRLTMSVDAWVKLKALQCVLNQLRAPLTSMSIERYDQLTPQLVIAAGWLHRRRRKLLQSICCTTEQQRDDLLNVCKKKLDQYR